ncbi:MAG: protease inhibitor I42 family protein [Deltaproteobacteria bacterium]|jgi:inhibitor of cysteine peptidase|nr:protease inhibitor I42 family protein [Deltaproteobacteria bacterium]MBW2533143.1 protease inhibitor I42 family protein [Deltaproteobacteria bacterium]
MHQRIRRASKLMLTVAASVALVWSTGCGTEEIESDGSAMTQAPELAESVIIDETGDGQTFDVVEGQDVILRLPGNPTTGYAWTVGSTDRTFGYPSSEEYVADGDRTGGSGVYLFVWQTDGALPMVGAHTVEMHYAREWMSEPEQTFTFTVNVIAADAPTTEPLVIDEGGDGQSFDVEAGTNVLVRLPGNPTTGYEWAVASTDRTFGYPESEQYIPNESEGMVGGGGVFELQWATSGALPMEGSHTVVLAYRRSWEEEPADTFTFTVNILGTAAH